MQTKNLLLTLLTALSFVLVGCAQNVSPDTYEASEVGVASQVQSGVIVAKRNVDVDANSGAGGLAGAVAGGAAGSTVGGSSAGHIGGAVGGAVIGGLAGNAIDKVVNHHKGIEYIIKLNKGATISVVQVADKEQFALHQRVLVITGKKTRIIADTSV